MLTEVVLVNFKSPPFIGIGGRRWGKMTKALLRQGVKVHLVRVNWGHQDSQQVPDWMNHPLLVEHVVPCRFHSKASLWHKCVETTRKWKASLLGEYSIYDEGRDCISGLTNTLSTIVSQASIEAFIVTGPPFSWIVEVTNWVSVHAREARIWVDIRDPWLTANNWGMSALSKRQRKLEQARYARVMQATDYVSSPTFSILEEMPQLKANCRKIHFPHFFDWEDWHACNGLEIREKTWVYSGQFYVGLEDYISRLRAIIEQEGLSAKWYFFSKDHDKFNHFLGDLPQVVISQDIGGEVYAKLAQAEGLILCLADYNKDYFTTKYYDYLPSGKPILYIGPLGKVAISLSHEKRNGINQLPMKDNFTASPVVFQLPEPNEVEELQKQCLEARCQTFIELLSQHDV